MILGPWEEDVSTWNVVITFSSSVDLVESAAADVAGGGDTWTLTNKDWDSDITAGDTLELRFIVGYTDVKPFVLSVTYVTESCDGVVSVVEAADGQWTGQVVIQAGEVDIQGWVLQMVFSAPLDYLDCIAGTVTGSGSVWSISSKDWDDTIPAGGHLDVMFVAGHSQAGQPTVLHVQLNDQEVCGGGEVCEADPPPGPDHCVGDYEVEDDQVGDNQQVLVNLVPKEVRSSFHKQS